MTRLIEVRENSESSWNREQETEDCHSGHQSEELFRSIFCRGKFRDIPSFDVGADSDNGDQTNNEEDKSST